VWGDPYIGGGGISTVSQAGPTNKALAWTKLQKTDHYSDQQTIDFGGTLGVSAVADQLPHNFLDEQWAFRDSAADFPKVSVQLPLIDDDGSGNSAPDDPYGTQTTGQTVKNLLQMAFRSGGTHGVPFSTGWTSTDPTQPGTSATLTGTLQNNVKACALIWASLVASGSYAVSTTNVPNGATGGNC
jgi:hypothetical protein